MFNSDYVFYGEHATYAKFLCKERGVERDDGVNVFNRVVDLLMVAPLVGVCKGRFVKQRDTTSEYRNDKSTVQLAQIDSERRDLMIIYRLVMLSGPFTSASDADRVDQALRFDSTPDSQNPNIEIFNGYVRGGIEYLYESFKGAPLNSENKKEWINDEIYDLINELSDSDTVEKMDETAIGISGINELDLDSGEK